MTIWLGFILSIGGSLAMGAISSFLKGHAGGNAWTGIGWTGFMVGAFLALAGLGYLLSRDERRFLVDFLRDTIAARDA